MVSVSRPLILQTLQNFYQAIQVLKSGHLILISEIYVYPIYLKLERKVTKIGKTSH